MVSVLKTLHQVAPQREHGFANELGFCTRKGVLGKEQDQGRWTRGSSGRLLPLFVSSEKLSAFSGLSSLWALMHPSKACPTPLPGYNRGT